MPIKSFRFPPGGTDCWRAPATWERHPSSCRHANCSGFPPFFLSLLTNVGHSPTLAGALFLTTFGSFPRFLCETRKPAMKLSFRIWFSFCFVSLLLLLTSLCDRAGWDPTAFTWQPGNQSFGVAVVTRVGGRERSIYHSRLCPLLEAYKIFRQRSLWKQQPKERKRKEEREGGRKEGPQTLASRQACVCAGIIKQEGAGLVADAIKGGGLLPLTSA